MREIRFRAWLKNEKRWAHETEVNVEATNPTLIHTGAAKYWHLHKDGVHMGGCPDVEAIELFTGLKDKNGKDIYEGDIVRASTGNCMVVWQDHTASFAFGMRGWMYNHFIEEMGELEVVGNKHENPELLT